MAQTPLSHFARTTNGRFLYGRCKNYRLASCLTSLVNYDGAQAGLTPLAGAAPVPATGTTANITPQTALVPNQRNNWPAIAGGGMSAPQPGGGIAVQDFAYARENAPFAQAVSNNWEWGDETFADLDVGWNASTPHNYGAAGTYETTFLGVDSLQRIVPSQFTVVAS
jgi:hypothetical protein